jgi:hypothetical protein
MNRRRCFFNIGRPPRVPTGDEADLYKKKRSSGIIKVFSPSAANRLMRNESLLAAAGRHGASRDSVALGDTGRYLFMYLKQMQLIKNIFR